VGSETVSSNLPELWQQILGSLELPSTRMLLSQQGQLVRLDANRAVVQVAGNWMGMVQSRAALLEQAIAKALGGNRQLVLEAGNTAMPSQIAPSPAPPPQAPPAPVATPAPIPAPTKPIAEEVAKPSLPRPTPTTKPAVPTSAVPPPAAKTLEAKTPAPQQTKAADFSSVDRQAKNLADFFNGQVLDVDLKN
tara:strand:+ start:198 stop:773 length:576 start_codon:yes stop_codon:yes gene_type:complete